jgi:L-ascorbate metabolism protein UlaG (beta-lactamase superfamily)
MILTKYEHACFTVEKDGKLVVVDPGEWTTDIGSPENVVAIVITHEHSDHFDVNALGALIAHNPEAIIYAHQNITRQFGDTLPHHAVAAGDTVDIAPFSFEFFGGEHAVIHESLPKVANLGVMINDSVYYPGDSFTPPDRPVKALALPVGAPWLKISDAIDFVTALKASFVFPTHDAVLSNAGKGLPDKMIPEFVQKYGGTYQRLSGPIEINE